MKKLILLFCLFTLSLSAQEIETPYSFPVPAGWGTEKIPFPISFAPSIPYKGIEEIRFAPGWSKKESDAYWSYVFLWYLDGKQKIDAKTIESHLKVYYEGLAAAMKSIPKEKLITAVVTNKSEKLCDDGGAFYEGTVLMLDYMTQKPLTLNYKVSVMDCKDDDKTVVLFRLSPLPLVHYMWKGLDKAAYDFKCKK